VVQAEDGIRDFHVTGVQTCALPIFIRAYRPLIRQTLRRPVVVLLASGVVLLLTLLPVQRMLFGRTIVPFPQIGSEFMPPLNEGRSEERRVGEERRGGGAGERREARA